ncbi:MAG: hypothetical protein PHO15_00145 [Eubacteriales bacterium]|nr:hypothetical protein [Eubacteriales bacterium]
MGGSKPKKMLVTNLSIMLIIGFVYMLAFMPFGAVPDGPVLKGNTGENNVALQIVIDGTSDIDAYMKMLEEFGVAGTFFFSEQCYYSNEAVLQQVLDSGHGIGYYVYEDENEDEDARLGLYLGGGYSVPVMSYIEGSELRQVCPSIDVTKLIRVDGWQQVLGETVLDDMFIYIDADNNFEDFEKIVQIVLDKGYTILKVNEML